MRWMAWLALIPCVAAASSSLSGTWSMLPTEGFTGGNRVVIVDVFDRIYFHYESDGQRRCEAFGVAQRRSDNLYVFRNGTQNQIWPGYEGYGTERNADCEISFERVGELLKVRSTLTCDSFCGMSAAIGGDLHKVPSEHPGTAHRQPNAIE